MEFVHESDEGIRLLVVVAPGARKNAFVGEYQGRLKIALSAPPVDGKANKALVRFLSGTLGCSKSQILLLRGEKSRIKEVLLTGISKSDLVKVLSF